MKQKIFGYARVSRKEQNLAKQIKELTGYVTEPDRDIYTDKASGKDFDRTGYETLIKTQLREGDLLIICSIDRLGRNYTEIMEQWKHITQTIGADIRVLDMPLLDTSKDTDTLDNKFVADLVLQILSYVSQKERENINDRIRKGIDAMPEVDGKKVSAKTQKPMGRPKAEYPENWDEVYGQWKNGEITAVKAMSILGLKRGTFYNLVKAFETK